MNISVISDSRLFCHALAQHMCQSLPDLSPAEHVDCYGAPPGYDVTDVSICLVHSKYGLPRTINLIQDTKLLGARIEVIALEVDCSDEVTRACLRAGASACLHSNSSVKNLYQTIVNHGWRIQNLATLSRVRRLRTRPGRRFTCPTFIKHLGHIRTDPRE